MARFKDYDWNLTASEGDARAARTWDDVKIAVLMDIRDELKRINSRLSCVETLSIPRLLREIKRNTTKRKYVRKAVAK